MGEDTVINKAGGILCKSSFPHGPYILIMASDDKQTI